MRSITIIVPAFNEEGNLSATVQGVVALLEKEFEDYEILIFNDCSTDQTGKIADQISSNNPKVKAIHNAQNMGFGYNVIKGIEMAKMEYVMMIPGDNDILEDSLKGMFKILGEKDIVIPYTANLHIRPLGRVIISKTFTACMNFLFGLNLKYFNGVVIHKRALIQSIKINTFGFTYQAEGLIKLIKAGHSYIQVPQLIRERHYGKSKALHPKNIVRVLKSITALFFEIYFKKA